MTNNELILELIQLINKNKISAVINNNLIEVIPLSVNIDDRDNLNSIIEIIKRKLNE